MSIDVKSQRAYLRLKTGIHNKIVGPFVYLFSEWVNSRAQDSDFVADCRNYAQWLRNVHELYITNSQARRLWAADDVYLGLQGLI